jgi:hypothetical protein
MMRWQQPSDNLTPPPVSLRPPIDPTASPPGGNLLPAWESFPLADRQLLVRLLVQAARRQVPSHPLDDPCREER